MVFCGDVEQVSAGFALAPRVIESNAELLTASPEAVPLKNRERSDTALPCEAHWCVWNEFPDVGIKSGDRKDGLVVKEPRLGRETGQLEV
jgi:hypothetical protein